MVGIPIIRRGHKPKSDDTVEMFGKNPAFGTDKVELKLHKGMRILGYDRKYTNSP